MNALEDVELVVKTTVIKLVEDLHPYKGIEDDGVEFETFLIRLRVVSEDVAARKVEGEGDD